MHLNNTEKIFTMSEYLDLIFRLAKSELDAKRIKLKEHGLSFANDQDALALLKSSMDGEEDHISKVYWHYMNRHLKALLVHQSLDKKELTKRMLDVYGYTVIGMALINTGLMWPEESEVEDGKLSEASKEDLQKTVESIFSEPDLNTLWDHQEEN